MSLLRLAWRCILGSPFRSGLVFLCVALVAGSAVAATLVVQGAQESLRVSLAGMEGLGADMVVVPGASGANRTGVREVDLEGLMGELVSVPGVEAASPQLLLLTLENSPLCAEPEMFLVALDPGTDFTVLNWWPDRLESSLGPGEAIAGSLVSAPPGEKTLKLAGYELKLVGRLAPTGGSLDQSLFVTFETARDMARRPGGQVEVGLDDAANNIPVLLVKAGPGSQADEVARRILKDIPGVSVFDEAHFFRRGREQMQSLLRSIPGLLGTTWVLSIVFTGLVFTIAVNERQREIGVLRALGSTRSFVLRSLLAEGLLLALSGGAVGAMVSALAGALFRDEIVQAVGLPLASPPPLALLLLASESLAVALIGTSLAVLFPAWRISRQDPAVAMRG